MTKAIRLKALGEVSVLKYQSLQGEMAQLLQRELGLRENLRQLVASRTLRQGETLRKSDPALSAGADIRWHKWVDERRAIINAELAQIIGQQEHCRARLQRSFAQDQAARALIKQSIVQEHQIRERRAGYES